MTDQSPLKGTERRTRPPSRMVRFAPLLAGGLLLILHASIFLNFFPNNQQALGHDFSYFFPALLDGYLWFQNNGFLEIPWFSPSACGGTLVYPNVVRGYYTVSQFLTFMVGPLTAVRITLVFFAGFGLWGAYLLLRRGFYLSQPVSIYGAGIFLFNGFFAHRMLIGHLGYCHFMFVPMIAYLILKPSVPGDSHPWSAILTSILGGFLLAAAVQSEFIVTMLPAILSIIVIGLIHGLIFGNTGRFILRLAATGLIGILLSLSRLTAILYLLDNFPRSTFKLPGADGMLEAAGLILRSLAVSPAYDPERLETFTNVQYFLERHEWEYSVTLVPFLIMAVGLAVISRRHAQKGWQIRLPAWRIGSFTLIGLLLLLPVALNSYYPSWNAFLKQIPIIKSSSSLIRWTILYIPIIILASSLAFEKMNLPGRLKTGAVLTCLAAIVLCNSLTDRNFYHIQVYDPDPIAKAYDRYAAGLQPPAINRIMVCRDKDTGAIAMPLNRNDAIAFGGSQMLCYEAILGYWLEFYPLKNLHPGPVMEVQEGQYNLKNPACYIWPEENFCEPGDHFKQTEAAQATAFANYQPFPFQMPPLQTIANWINGICLLAAILFITCYYLIDLLKRFHAK